MQVLEVNPGSERTGAHILKLIGEATMSHRVSWRDSPASGAHAQHGLGFKIVVQTLGMLGGHAISCPSPCPSLSGYCSLHWRTAARAAGAAVFYCPVVSPLRLPVLVACERLVGRALFPRPGLAGPRAPLIVRGVLHPRHPTNMR
jgi:hypothetical protein